MKAFVAAAIALVQTLSLGAAHAQATACGTDAASLNGFRVGGLGLTFTKGAFSIESTVALDKGTETRFSINANGGLSLALHRANAPAAAPWINMDATGLKKVKGIMTEEVQAGKCRRRLILDQGALNGAKLKGVNSDLPGVWGGTLKVQAGTGTLSDSSLIQAKASGAQGSITAVLKTGVAVNNAKVAIQDNGPLLVTLSARGDILVTLDLARVAAEIAEGELVATGVAISRTRLQAADVLITGMKGSAKELWIKAGSPGQLRITGLSGTADSMTHGAKTNFSAAAVDIKRLDELVWPQLTFSPGQALAKTQGDRLSGGEFACATCSYVRTDGTTALTGRATLTVRTVTMSTVDASATWAKPDIAGLSTLRLATTVNSLTASMSGPKSAVVLSGAHELAKLTMGRLRIDGALKGLWKWSEEEQVVQTQTTFANNPIQLGRAPDEAVSGTVKKGDVTAVVASSGGSVSSITVPSNALRVSYLPKEARLAMMGGWLTMPIEVTAIANDAPLVVSAKGVAGNLPIAVSKATVASLKMKAAKDLAPSPIQASPAILAKPDIRLSMAPESDPSPSLLVLASVDLPGFVIRPPDGITAIDVEISGYEVSLTELAAQGFRIEWLGDKIKVSMLKFLIGARSIVTPLDTHGKPKTAPYLDGRFSKPPTIGETFIELQLWPEPLKTAEMGLHDFVFALEGVHFSSPGVADVEKASLNLDAKTLTDTEIDAVMTATAGSIKWSDSLSGTGSLESLQMTLKGPRLKPNGSVSLRVPEIALKGTSAIEIGETSDTAVIGCGVKFDASTSGYVRSIEGTIPITAGVPDGYITAGSVDDVKVQYSGRKECTWDWRHRFEWSFKYPCIGTWDDPWRECEAKDSKTFRIPLTFSVHSVQVGGQITEVRYHVVNEKDDDGKEVTRFKRCHARLRQLYSIGFPPFYAQVGPDWSDVPDWLRGSAQTAYDSLMAPFFYTLSSAPIDLVALAVWSGIPVYDKPDC